MSKCSTFNLKFLMFSLNTKNHTKTQKIICENKVNYLEKINFWMKICDIQFFFIDLYYYPYYNTYLFCSILCPFCCFSTLMLTRCASQNSLDESSQKHVPQNCQRHLSYRERRPYKNPLHTQKAFEIMNCMRK